MFPDRWLALLAAAVLPGTGRDPLLHLKKEADAEGYRVALDDGALVGHFEVFDETLLEAGKSGPDSSESGPSFGEFGVDSGEIGVKPGEIGGQSGELGVNSGEFGVKPGEFGVSAGESGVNLGEFGVKPGEFGASSGESGVKLREFGVKPGESDRGSAALRSPQRFIDTLPRPLLPSPSLGNRQKGRDFRPVAQLVRALR
ncbi:MAG TPA: hypothetical protein VGX68_14135 [Thermoanaerobaculia bacterium]|nr:hypothetical protein [Thermoanaerobaculia bacterium]